MNPKILLLVITLLCVSHVDLYSDNNPKKETQSPSKEEIAVASKTIKEFYVAYTTNIAISKDPSKHKFEEDLKTKYLTKKALYKVAKVAQENNYDLVINAQDFQEDAIRTITVTHVDGDWYAVAYLDTYEKICVIIPVRVIKQDSRYLIDEITVQ